MRKRNRHKIIIGIEVMILSITVSLLGTNAASSNPPSNGVSYNKNGQVTVENALDNLYSKANYGNASAGDILKGKKALVGGKEVVGTFTCPTLASLTPGDAIASNIDKGKIAWVNGKRIVGTYTPPISSTPTTPNSGQLLFDVVEIGDFVSYTPSKTSYIVSKEDSQTPLDQVINPSELNLWVVIRKNDDGTVELVSYSTSSRNILFYRAGGYEYKNYIGLLNKIAKSYETEGITVGSRHMGYDGKAEEYLTEMAEDGNEDQGYREDVKLVSSALGSLSTKNEKNYYIASRGPRYNNNLAKDGLICQAVATNHNGIPIVEVECSEVHGELTIRPIVTLKAKLKIVGGEGSESDPYRFENTLS